MTLLHCTHITRSLPVVTPSHPPSTLHLKLLVSLLYFCSSLRHRKYVQRIIVVFSSRCHGSTVCFRHSDRHYCHSLASAMTGFREKPSICRGSEGTRCWNYVTCVAMLPAPTCRAILGQLCSYCVSSIQMSSATSFHPSLCHLFLKNTSKHAQKRRF